MKIKLIYIDILILILTVFSMTFFTILSDGDMTSIMLLLGLRSFFSVYDEMFMESKYYNHYIYFALGLLSIGMIVDCVNKNNFQAYTLFFGMLFIILKLIFNYVEKHKDEF